ncbi:MAG TPA: YggS family pyridoxal phosphate-dependent enzyme [Patescibacteria group bacterium]|nr:YggS family pyridoxal phosphate-dependent enzyme [Patescibacteria group bacterium]
MTSGGAAALGKAREFIVSRIARAAERAGRDPGMVQVVAVTKTVPPERILAAIGAGFTTLGENRVQERQAKVAEIDAVSTWPVGEQPRWHLIGPLQSNKARRAVELFDVIETVDSLALAQRLDRISAELRPAGPLPVLLQVNVDADEAKAGFDPASLAREIGEIVALPALSVEGLMTVGRVVPEPELARPTFVALRELSERLRAREPRLGAALSMGMTDDFEVAVEEGATLVRIGRAIFGARPALG